MGICCMAQETQTGALYQSSGVGWGRRWEGVSKGRGYMYTYGLFMLKLDRKQQNSVKQLSSNKKLIKKREKTNSLKSNCNNHTDVTDSQTTPQLINRFSTGLQSILHSQFGEGSHEFYMFKRMLQAPDHMQQA